MRNDMNAQVPALTESLRLFKVTCSDAAANGPSIIAPLVEASCG